jgi:AcrR family transcriptional regulator|nr:TetR/AcrR family transcriptional regulator [uncultured Flavobacterium sp.]
MEKEQIIKCSAKIFKKQGFKNVKMDDLATNLSISKKTFYQHFQNKIELISYCQEYLFDDFLAEMELKVNNEKEKENKAKITIVVSQFVDFIDGLDQKAVLDLEDDKICKKMTKEFITQFKNYVTASFISENDLNHKKSFDFITTLFIESVISFKLKTTDFGEIKTELKSTFIDLFIVNFFEQQNKETLFESLLRKNKKNI